MNAQLLSAVAGAVLSLLFSYIPGLNVWFAKQESTYKRLFMGSLLLLVASAVFGLSCTSWGSGWGINITCDQAGLQALVGSFLAALVANQSTYSITSDTKKVKLAKAARA